MTDRPTRSIKGAVLLAVVLGVLLSFVIFAAGGCTPEAVQGMKDVRGQVEQVRVAATQSVDELQAAIADLPADDPVRVALEAKLAKVNATLAKAEKWLPRADALIKLAETGDLTSPEVKALASAVPYGTLALALLGIGTSLVQTGRYRTLFNAGRQIVLSIEKAIPEKSLGQKMAMNAVQDEATRKLVDKLKGA